MPAVAGLKKQGANNGACLSFLISTPESGVDSIALTYSLLDPIITVMRPFTAFVTALAAGLVENFAGGTYQRGRDIEAYRTCLVDACCDGTDCTPSEHAKHHTATEKLVAGFRFAFDELMNDLAGWFILGILLAGIINALVPESFVSANLGSGFLAYLGMLAVSLPMYICASMSTPVAAALILKGMSPGAALVLLMAGPATNMATIAMVGGILGRRTLGIYLGSIVICTMVAAFVLDLIYAWLGISAKVAAGASAGELVPVWLEWLAAAILAGLIIRVLWKKVDGARRTRPSALEASSPQTPCCDDPKAGGT
ncbi:MAG: permease [Desulfomonile tiedjei]|nr:permease [Desulfomonile tiedjei]